MKLIIPLFLALACADAFSGTLTIVPDSTSTMGIKQQSRDAAASARAARQARIAAGVERPPSVIIIKQAPQYQPPPKTNFNCRSYGYQNSQISCY